MIRLAHVLLVLTLFVLSSCTGEPKEIVPMELRGHWIAQGGMHDGLSFRIDCRRLLIEGAEDSFDRSAISDVDVSRIAAGVEYDLLISAVGGETDHFRVHMHEGVNDVLYLHRTAGTRWVRESTDGSDPWPGDPPCASDSSV